MRRYGVADGRVFSRAEVAARSVSGLAIAAFAETYVLMHAAKAGE